MYVDEEETQDGKEIEGNGQEDSNGGGMSTLEKALLASDLAMMGSKVHGWVSGRKNGSAVEGQNTLSMKVKGAANRAKNAGKNLYNRAGNKMRGMKKTLMKGKNIGSKLGKGFKRVKGVMSKGMPILSKVGKVGILLGKVGRKKREMEEKFRRF